MDYRILLEDVNTHESYMLNKTFNYNRIHMEFYTIANILCDIVSKELKADVKYYIENGDAFDANNVSIKIKTLQNILVYELSARLLYVDTIAGMAAPNANPSSCKVSIGKWQELDDCCNSIYLNSIDMECWKNMIKRWKELNEEIN